MILVTGIICMKHRLRHAHGSVVPRVHTKISNTIQSRKLKTLPLGVQNINDVVLKCHFSDNTSFWYRYRYGDHLATRILLRPICPSY